MEARELACMEGGLYGERTCKWEVVLCEGERCRHGVGCSLANGLVSKVGAWYVRSCKWERGACHAWEKGRWIAFGVLANWILTCEK